MSLRLRASFCIQLPRAATIGALLSLPVAANAQENMVGPPDVLQFLVETHTGTDVLATAFIRYAIEQAADTTLCQVLLKAAGQPIPSDFTLDKCPTELRNKVKNNEGLVHWRSNSRPVSSSGRKRCAHCRPDAAS